jgi:hypothetical protein
MRRWRTPTPATAPPSTSRYSITCGNATTPRSAPGHPQPAAGLARREPPGYSLGCWLREYKEQVFLFTRVFAVSWTNNVSERGAKAAKRHQAVSGYWHSLATLARWCRLRSYLDTSAAHGITALDAIRAAIAGKPWPPPLPAIALHQFTAPREWTPANAQITARRPTGIVGWWLNSDHVVGCPDWNILLVRRARGGGCWSPFRSRWGVLPVAGTLRNRQLDDRLLRLGDQVVTVHEQQPRACSLDPHLGFQRRRPCQRDLCGVADQRGEAPGRIATVARARRPAAPPVNGQCRPSHCAVSLPDRQR